MGVTKDKQGFLTIEARPYPFSFPLKHTALLVIDMQRDFICSGGFGEIQGGNLEAVQASIAPTKQLLEACRSASMLIVHTREGQVPSLADCPSSKLIRQAAAPGNKQHLKVIGDKGEMGRLLVRGEYGHDIVDELQPLPAEVVIDKPGKGSFWNTQILHKLKAHGITHLLVSGVTTECCFSTTVREANDRGFECCGIVQSTAGYNPAFKTASLDMIYWSQGLFGFVADLQPVVDVLSPWQNQSKGVNTPPQTPPAWNGRLGIADLHASYKNGLSPLELANALCDRIEKYEKIDPAVWIRRESRDAVLEQARRLLELYPDKHSRPALFGVPFTVKDSIDVQGVETTTACPPLAFVATRSAAVYQKVMAQGALYLGKVNLDQLATGLSGCRSPFGVTHSVFSDDHISGGSSSGSCVSVGADLATFSLATDTAGSGRVPAGYNGVVGFKPTRGLVSFEGITPACLSLDCIAFTTRTVDDARTLWQLCEDYDENDRYSRDTFPAERHVNSLGAQREAFRFGIPPPEVLEVCSPTFRKLFNEAVHQLQSMGGSLVSIDWTPFQKAGDLLYAGTFVSERLASLPDDFLEKNRQHLHPVILELFEEVVARQSTAVQLFRDLQAKALYTRQATAQFAAADRLGIDVLVVPTAPEHPTIKAMLADPIRLNAKMGTFTHFGNVLDMCAVAVPAATYREGEAGPQLPFSVTLLGCRCSDSEVLGIASRFQARTGQ
ncbi:allophanate hydrolase [Cladophialophora carrionii CBS 160.54]|uniref:Allophanate hydrolase n=1 Tax=Cladophialophora carrionii CBS 160.54 TaxID=1279043 RepID=V9DNL0_9EURO|nr:allophanate hydrolase [Cladophialophora carrionii CBS 160.54]ETI28465.1 allophanate hydrolase [Cladophialophora carrionii CBS 160.54]